jgi:hypothetical protein
MRRKAPRDVSLLAQDKIFTEKMTAMKFLLPLAVALLSSFAVSAPALAEDLSGRTFPLEVNHGKSVNVIPQSDVEADFLIKQHCTKCHSESRIMSALQSMQNSQDGNYDKEIKNIISSKIRLTNGNISRQDGKKIIEYLVSVSHHQNPLKRTLLKSLPTT